MSCSFETILLNSFTARSLFSLYAPNEVKEMENLLNSIRNSKIERGIMKGMERLKINQKLLDRMQSA